MPETVKVPSFWNGIKYNKLIFYLFSDEAGDFYLYTPYGFGGLNKSIVFVPINPPLFKCREYIQYSMQNIDLPHSEKIKTLVTAYMALA